MIKIIKGGAGTGKTHQIKSIYQGNPTTTVVVCPTNKAAGVLKLRGIPAHTLHSALYSVIPTGKFKIVCTPVLNAETKRPAVNANGEIVYHEVEEEICEYQFNEQALYTRKLISPGVPLSSVTLVIDEASMISAATWKKLLNEFSGNIIAVGDEKQLAPIESELDDLEKQLKDTDETTLLYKVLKAKYDDLNQYRNYFANAVATQTLSTVYRQAAGSGILTVASSVINTGHFPKEFSANGAVCDDWDKSGQNLNDPTIKALLSTVDIVICHKVAVCNHVNAHIRSIKFEKEFEKLSEPKKRLPRVSDKLYVTTKCKLANDDVIDKGQQLIITNIVQLDAINNIIYCDVINDAGAEFLNVPVSLQFATGKGPDKKIISLKVIYGYAITCHKSQGSQWPSVMVIDERTHHITKNWRYTAATRASEFLYVGIWGGASYAIGK